MQVEPWVYIGSTVLQVLLTGTVGAIGWWVRQSVEGQRRSNERALDIMEKRIAAVEAEHVHREEFERLSVRMESAVTKEEWLRDVSANRHRLDGISSKLDGLSGASQASIEIASAIAAALNRERTGSNG